MSTDHERFTRCWHEDAPRILAYARRHVGSHAAHDVVSETFLAAWRRWDDVPDPAIAWLLGTARRVIGNQHRTDRRLRALADRIVLLDTVAADAEDAPEAALHRAEALQHLAGLTEEHREALLLVSWDGLSTEQAATVLGLRPAAFRRRDSRARAALVRLAEGPPGRPRDPAPAVRPPFAATTTRELR